MGIKNVPTIIGTGDAVDTKDEVVLASASDATIGKHSVDIDDTSTVED